jgi:hypothetical protein
MEKYWHFGMYDDDDDAMYIHMSFEIAFKFCPKMFQILQKCVIITLAPHGWNDIGT